MCPLCELYISWKGSCPECPLETCRDGGSLFEEWHWSKSAKIRRVAAQAIVDKIQAWEPEEQEKK